MQRDNDWKLQSPHSSRYDENSKYPYRAASGIPEDDVNGYSRTTQYDKPAVRPSMQVICLYINHFYE